MKVLQKDLAKMRLDIEQKVIEKIKNKRLNQREDEDIIIEKNYTYSFYPI
jgi:hypothetical protein